MTTPTDPGCATGCGGGTFTTGHIPVGDGPNFSATKTADKSSYIVGQAITYTIVETNSGAGAGSATVTDTVPGLVTVNSVSCVTSVATDTCVPGPQTNNVAGSVTLSPGATATFTITGVTNATGDAENSVVTTPTDPGCATQCGGGHSPPRISRWPAIRISSRPRPPTRAPTSWERPSPTRLSVTNNGMGSGSAIVTDTVPALDSVSKVACVTSVATDTCVPGPQTNNVAGSVTLSPGATATFTISGVTNAAGDAQTPKS